MEETKLNFARYDDKKCFMHVNEGSFFIYGEELFLKIDPVELEDSCGIKNAIKCETSIFIEFDPQDKVTLVKNAIFEY